LYNLYVRQLCTIFAAQFLRITIGLAYIMQRSAKMYIYIYIYIYMQYMLISIYIYIRRVNDCLTAKHSFDSVAQYS